MKKTIAFTLLTLLLFALAACGGNVDPESLVESASDVAEEVVDSVTEQLSETSLDADESDAEAGEHAEVQFKTACDPAATVGIPAPTEAEVTVRFVNASGRDLVGMWRDTSQSPAQNIEYFQLADGETYNQETFAGHEWFVEDEAGNIWEYVATAKVAQCVGLYRHFGYAGEEPDEWAELTAYYHTCASNAMQSPVNLTDAAPADLQNIDFEYGNTAVNILNNGHTVQVGGITNNKITIDGTTYALQQFHFHKPSEHTVDGKPYPIEMHLVHKSDDGRFAVVGVLIDEGTEENSAFAPVWAHLPGVETGGVINNTGETVNVADLLPAQTERLVYRYTGSLTTPPCTEGILWSVMTTPVLMSSDQIDDFESIFEEGINRPVQPVNEQGLQIDNTP